jgi:hypothetical protein
VLSGAEFGSRIRIIGIGRKWAFSVNIQKFALF